MKITIQDDDGTILYEQENPGYVHLPMIMDTEHDVECEDDPDCPDPRCVRRREKVERILKKWQAEGAALAYMLHPGGGDHFEEFCKQPNWRVPMKVRLAAYSRTELVFSNGVRVGCGFPAVNVYSDKQVMFKTKKWNLSLSPWSEELYLHMKENAEKEDRREAAKNLETTPSINAEVH